MHGLTVAAFHAYATPLAPFTLFFSCLFVPIALVAFAFWLWMLIDCINHMPSQGNDKIMWVLIIVLTGWIGALIYFFVVKQKRPG